MRTTFRVFRLNVVDTRKYNLITPITRGKHGTDDIVEFTTESDAIEFIKENQVPDAVILKVLNWY